MVSTSDTPPAVPTGTDAECSILGRKELPLKFDNSLRDGIRNQDETCTPQLLSRDSVEVEGELDGGYV